MKTKSETMSLGDLDLFLEEISNQMLGRKHGEPYNEKYLMICGFGLGGEVGEVQEQMLILGLGLGHKAGQVQEILKKRERDGNFDLTALVKELGDVLAYWMNICRFFGVSPQQVISVLVAKLKDRQARGVLKGSGNER